MNFFDKDKKEVLEYLESDSNGLSYETVKLRQERDGLNELPKKKKDSILKLFISQFQNPIELILVFTAVLSFFVGEVIDGIAITFIILVDVIMGTYQEWKALKDAEALASMIQASSKVIREGKEYVVNSTDICIGDIVVLESGDKIPADGRVIEEYNLQVDESSLTGESLAANKNDEVLKSDVSLADRTNMVCAGTSVVTGRARYVVTAIGVNTELGKIADKVTNTKEEKSPLTIRTEKFSKQITVIIIFVAAITSLVLLSRGNRIGEIFLSVIALSVSAMPEGLPLAFTMALTIASKRMAKKNVIVKKLNSVESLGSCTVIASDKTGTLTVNEQTAKEIVLANGDRFNVTGIGYNGEGQVNPIDDADLDDAYEIGLLGAINNEAHLEYKNNNWVSFGDSIDIAFLAMAEKLHVDGKPKVLELIPYESENQYSAVFYEKNGETYCTVKGSLEKVLSFSLDNEDAMKYNEELTAKGYRVIAIADGKVKGTNKEDIKKLVFKGLVAFIDPIRDEVKDSIKECHNAGIKVLMVTGDHPLTAFAIAKDLGLTTKKSEVATGKDVAKYREMGEKKFDEFVSNIKVFSRVTPMDKLDIVESLKRQGEFVAVTGDGVNDAPAIKAANIGIAMGSGTDVAKETASMIITDDNFTSIVSGIKEGRTAYSNIRKITLFLLGCGFAEVCFFLLSIMFGYDIPLVAIQLLWLNMVTDGLQDISLSFEKSEEDIMNEKPRDTKESLFSKDLMMEVLILGFTITVVVFGVWKYLMDNGTDLIVARSIIMMLMVFIQNVNVLNCRSEKRTLFKEKLDNGLLFFTIAGSIGLQILFAQVPFLSQFLQVQPIGVITIFEILLLSLVVIVIYEIYKLIYRLGKKVK